MKNSIFFAVAIFIGSTSLGSAAPSGKQKVDILWVVDDSGSMSANQKALASSIDSLFKAFTASPLVDWQMAMISTDADAAPQLGFTTVVNNQTPDPAGLLAATLQKLGTNGSATEQTFDPISIHLSKPTPFLRSDALLAVVLVSDAEEQSKQTADAFLQYLVGLKGGMNLVSFSGVLAAMDLDSQCPNEGWKYAGSALEKVITQTDGRLYSLCAPSWPATLSDIHTDIVRRLR